MTVRYNARKIRTLVESLSTIYAIPMQEWIVTYGSAMVLHGELQVTEDLDITLPNASFEYLSAFIKPQTDQLGEWIEIPGNIEIRPRATFPVDLHTVKINHLTCQSQESLISAYGHLVANPIPGRLKTEQDDMRRRILVEARERESNLGKALAEEYGGRYGAIIAKIIKTNVFNEFMKHLNGTTTRIEFKDDQHVKWRMTANGLENTVAIGMVNQDGTVPCQYLVKLSVEKV